jgi:hypothetical protein
MDEADPPPRKFILKAKDFTRENVPSTPPPPTVHEVLQANLTVQKSVEPEVLPHLHDRRTKRRQDYWITMLAGNLLAAGCALLLPLNADAIVGLLAFVALFNLGLLWVMFQVMDKY